MAALWENSRYISYAAILALMFIFFKMIEPYASYLALGVILAILILPVHYKINSFVKHERISAALTTFFAILAIVIPTILMLSSLVGEILSFITHLNLSFVKDIGLFLAKFSGQESYLSDNLRTLLTSGSQYLLSLAPDLLNSVTQFSVGMLLLFFITYYVLVDADKWNGRLRLILPLNPKQQDHLITVTKKVVGSALYGEILIAIIQGVLGGILFYMLGIPNPIFWGFIMGVLAFLPLVGTALVWGPVAIMRLLGGETLTAIIVVIYGVVLMSGIDYFLRPKIIAQASRIHPLTALLGAFGGLHFFGFQGLILGPMIAALVEAVVIFYYEEQKLPAASPAETRGKRKK